jgi:aquaporin Z
MMTNGGMHWREYGIEAICLAAFMCSAAAFATLLQHSASPLAIGGATALTRLPMGVAMGLTAMALIYSPWGQRSGAHMNPAVTLTFLCLGKMARLDAAMYVVAQVVGGIGGIVVANLALDRLPSAPSVNYVATVPGAAGAAAALASEAAISFVLMLVVLIVSNHERMNRLTGVFAGALVCAYIVFEAPLSGMSMNPARSLGPALLAGTLDSMWIYIIGPVAGMMLAAEAYTHLWPASRVKCAKFDHPAGIPCIFRCRLSEASL